MKGFERRLTDEFAERRDNRSIIDMPNRNFIRITIRTIPNAAMALTMLVAVGASSGCTWPGFQPLMARNKEQGDRQAQPLPMQDVANRESEPQMTDSSDASDHTTVDGQDEPSDSPQAAYAASNASPMSTQGDSDQISGGSNGGGTRRIGATSRDDATGAPADSFANVAIVGLTFDVMNVELPAESAESSARIWKHIDESNADPSLPALLARNGVRIGVADENDWPALRAMFEQGGARTSRDQMSVQPGYPALINIGSLESGGMYFLHRRGGKVEGGTFDDGDRVVRLDYEIPPEDPTVVLVRVTLEARSGADRRFVQQGGEVRELAVRDGESFGELACLVRLVRGQYLVLGSAENADTGFRIGSWWFRAERGDRKFETLVCIRPDPVRVQ